MAATIDSVCDLLVRTGLMSAETAQLLRQHWLLHAGDFGTDGDRFLQWLVGHQQVTAEQAEQIRRDAGGSATPPPDWLADVDDRVRVPVPVAATSVETRPPDWLADVDDHVSVAPVASGKRHRWGVWAASAAFLAAALALGIWAAARGKKPATNVPVAPLEAATPVAGATTFRPATLTAEQQVQAFSTELKQRNPTFDGAVKPTIQDDVVTGLEFSADGVTDLAPLRVFTGLKRLCCAGSGPGQGQLTDLTPLQGLPLAVLDCSNTRVASLAPLQGMSLIFLDIGATQVRDLTPLRGMPLMVLNCAATHVGDLTPLAGMALNVLDAADTPVKDLAPLKSVPLEVLWCHVQPERDAELLRAVRTLKEINGKPAAEVWAQAQDEAWLKRVAGLPADQQVPAVVAELKKRNPSFDGKVAPTIEDGRVTELRFVCDAVTDISPVRALTELKRLHCHGSQPEQGKLANLQPLHGLKLTELDCGWSKVNDLTPLAGMPLTSLSIAGNTGIDDLTPLAGMPLTYLQLEGNAEVSDLAPLKGLPLTRLNVASTQVRDLAPLRDLKLTSLAIHRTQVVDLSVLKAMPLSTLSLDFRAGRDLTLLRTLQTLERINNKPAAEFLKDADAQEQLALSQVKRIAALPADEQIKAIAADLKKRNPAFDGKIDHKTDARGLVTEVSLCVDQVTDVAPLQALTELTRLACTGSGPGKGRLFDLSPLKGLTALKTLSVSSTAVTDLTPLQDLALEELNIADTPVTDLAALEKMPLKSLDLSDTNAEDLTPLKEVEEIKFGDVGADDAEVLAAKAAKGSGLIQVGDKPGGVRRRAATLRFIARVARINATHRTVTVQLRHAIIVQSRHHTFWALYHRLRWLQARFIPNPLLRMRRLQHEAFWFLYHRLRMFHLHLRTQSVELALDADSRVRVLRQPLAFDAKGKPRKYTAAELAELKGPDKLPGYTADFDAITPGQFIEVRVSPADLVKPTGKENKPADGKDRDDAKPRAAVVVVLQ